MAANVSTGSGVQCPPEALTVFASLRRSGGGPNGQHHGTAEQGNQAAAPRVATVFPNEASLPRLASAEVCEEWETGKIYLNVENRSSPRKQ